MAEHISKLTQAAIKKAYINGEGSKTALADRFKVSLSTVKRITKGLEPVQEAAQHIVDTAVARHIELVRDRSSPTVIIGSNVLDTDEIMVTAIKDLSADMSNTPAKTKEGVAGSLIRFIETYRKFHPVTMDEAIELVLSIPDFDPRVFAQKLRDRIERKAG